MLVHCIEYNGMVTHIVEGQCRPSELLLIVMKAVLFIAEMFRAGPMSVYPARIGPTEVRAGATEDREPDLSRVGLDILRSSVGPVLLFIMTS